MKLAVRPPEAAAMLSVSLDYFDKHVRPSIGIIREGRLSLVPVKELERWTAERSVNLSQL